MTEFANKIAVVTGAAAGLGKAVALGLARGGAKLVFLLDTNEAALSVVAAEIGPAGVPLQCDVSQEGLVDCAWDEIIRQTATLDILVTSAGILGPAVSVSECTADGWDNLYAVNVRGAFLVVRKAIPMMRAAGGGAIVTLGSTAGLAGAAMLGPYSSTKGAIVMMTRSLALSHAKSGIRVNCVCPGSIETDMLAATFASVEDEAARSSLREISLTRIPMGRFGRSDDVAKAVLFLASDAASYVTGVALPVDGGLLA